MQSITYVLCGPSLCGGVKVAAEHVHRLAQRGHPVEIFCPAGDWSWFPHPLPVRAFHHTDDLGRALRAASGIKIATWWQTASWVRDCLNPGDRGLYLVQDIETSYARTAEEAAQVLASYALGLEPITEGHWVDQQLRQRGLQTHYVGLGLDDAYFPTSSAANSWRDPHRLFAQYRDGANGSGINDLKGTGILRQLGWQLMDHEPRLGLVTFGTRPQASPGPLPWIHVIRPSDAKLRALYAEAGTFVLTSQHEGFGLTAAEAMACGTPVVATRAQGNEEFCLDGQTCLLADPDAASLAARIRELLADPARAAELAAAGRAFVQRYRWDAAIDRLEAVLAV